MILLNENIIRYFYTEGKISQSRTYFYILRLKRSDLHKSDILEACKFLNINPNTFMNHLSYLKKIGAIIKYNKNYWGLVSWKKWLPDIYHKYYNGNKSNRILEVDKKILKSNSDMRSKVFFTYIKQAYYLAKHNRKQIEYYPKHLKDVKKDSCLEECSANFINAACSINLTPSTYYKYMKILILDNLITVKTRFETLFKCKSICSALDFKKSNEDIQNVFLLIKRSGDNFFVGYYKSNLISIH